MKRSSFKILAILLAIFLIFTTALSFSAKIEFNNLQTKSADEIGEELLVLDRDKMLSVVKYAFDAVSETEGATSSSLIPYASSLYLRINEFSEDEVLEIITDEKSNEALASSVLQAYKYNYENKTSKGNNAVKRLILSEETPEELKHNAIVLADYSEFNAADTELLVNIFENSNGVTAYHALIQLSRFNSEKAEKLADEILKDYENADPEKLNGAITAKGEILRNGNRKAADTDNFSELCLKITADPEIGVKIKDSASVQLIEFKDKETLRAVLTDENIDDCFKVTAMDKNTEVMLKILNEDSDGFEFVSEAMKICPIEELRQPLEEKAKAEKINGFNFGKIVSRTSTLPSNYSYSAYRDNVYIPFIGDAWHAALLVEDHAGKANCLVEHTGSGVVKYSGWESIYNDYVGTYRPKASLTTKQKLNVVTTAKTLVTKNIKYTPTALMHYKKFEGVNKVEPSHIESIRCDGVTEYCYEYNGIRISGADGEWDISKPGDLTWGAHATWNVTPRKQAETYMKFVTSATP